MIEVALSVLMAKREEEGGLALRDWAVTVLQNPDDPPRLTDDAAELLRLEGYRVLSVLRRHVENPSSSLSKNALAELSDFGLPNANRIGSGDFEIEELEF